MEGPIGTVTLWVGLLYLTLRPESDGTEMAKILPTSGITLGPLMLSQGSFPLSQRIAALLKVLTVRNWMRW